MVTSSKGGIGKSTVATGLALALCEQGMKVLLVDCDFGNCCLDMLLGAENRVIFTLADLMEGRASTEDVLLQPDIRPDGKLYFCAAPRGGADTPAAESLVDALKALEAAVRPDLTVVDTAAGIEVPGILAERFADGALLVASQMPVSVRAAETTAARLSEKGMGFIRLVINNFEASAVRSGERAGILSIIDQTAVRTIGVVPTDRSLMLAQEEGRAPAEGSPAAAAFRNIARRLNGETVRLFTGIRGVRLKKLY